MFSKLKQKQNSAVCKEKPNFNRSLFLNESQNQRQMWSKLHKNSINFKDEVELSLVSAPEKQTF